MGAVDGADQREVSAAAGKLFSPGAKQAKPQRAHAAHAAIVCGAAAEGDGDVALCRRHEGKARRLGHLYHGAPVGEERVGGHDRPAEGVVRRRVHHAATLCEGERPCGALSAVCHGDGLRAAAGEVPSRRGGKELCRLGGAQRALERIRCEQKAWHRPLLAYALPGRGCVSFHHGSARRGGGAVARILGWSQRRPLDLSEWERLCRAKRWTGRRGS